MKIKYPRTLHLPWSPGATSDDKIMSDTMALDGMDVVVTEKMDGQNTTLYRDGCHARSLTSERHWSSSYVKSLQASIASLIPDCMRICGENLYARHTIRYKDLKSYFLVFSIWDGETCLDWDSTEALCAEMGLHTVPVLYRGRWSDNLSDSMYNLETSKGEMEGYVVRSAGAFSIDDFPTLVGKYVRANHVEGDAHWKNKPPEINGLVA